MMASSTADAASIGNDGEGKEVNPTNFPMQINGPIQMNPTPTPLGFELSRGGGKKARAPAKGPAAINKKPPGAPKRFKSSFIFFSMQKHKSIKEDMARDAHNSEKHHHVNITKLVAEAWRSMEPDERAIYDELARADKERYEREKAAYPGLIGGPGSRKQRDPNAPKRPMSAYLSFANGRRGVVKAQNPECTNGEISKILSVMWKEAEVTSKQKFRDEESALWASYKIKMVKWKKENDGRKKRGSANAEKAVAGVAAMEAASRAHTDNNKSLEATAQGPYFPAEANNQQIAPSSMPGAASQPAYPSAPSATMSNGNHQGQANQNNTTDEIMAASALSGVRGAPSNYPFGAGIGSAGNNAPGMAPDLQSQFQQGFLGANGAGNNNGLSMARYGNTALAPGPANLSQDMGIAQQLGGLGGMGQPFQQYPGFQMPTHQTMESMAHALNRGGPQLSGQMFLIPAPADQQFAQQQSQHFQHQQHQHQLHQSNQQQALAHFASFAGAQPGGNFYIQQPPNQAMLNGANHNHNNNPDQSQSSGMVDNNSNAVSKDAENKSGNSFI